MRRQPLFVVFGLGWRRSLSVSPIHPIQSLDPGHSLTGLDCSLRPEVASISSIPFSIFNPYTLAPISWHSPSRRALVDRQPHIISDSCLSLRRVSIFFVRFAFSSSASATLCQESGTLLFFPVPRCPFSILHSPFSSFDSNTLWQARQNVPSIQQHFCENDRPPGGHDGRPG